ncbi:RIB43A-like coiled-coils protein [Chloropicon primus]|uniref:RIB43A-like coiled-coils protein n=1 Tax=Chloropicon primus TaxID=1764295 RepID=A0A5B8MH37_9CHLO|nr:RIB43A-like coiled-coils protein [Chloropicon primus]UPQ97880.1 RIB43A-like coiled-coils protein [Chloropicon primus]|eukprot:QDZ18672.1 RIB43A-like coiled-coils protein [Chloropicon primus]
MTGSTWELDPKTIGGASFPRTRRVNQEERRTLILNAKERTIGVDKDVLAAQSAAKEERNRKEKEQDQYYAKQAQFYDNIICQKVQDALKQQREAKMRLVDFHRENQTKESTREWDLNRKDILKIEPPLGSIESTLRPSSLQKFEGEDVTAADRRDLQIKQQRTWIEKQKQEKQDRKNQEVQESVEYSGLLKRQQAVQAYAEMELNTSRKHLQSEIAQANKELAESKRQRELLHKSDEAKLNEEEINATLSSERLNENPVLAVHSNQPWRVRTDHWKGMADDEKDKIRQYQQTQRVEAEEIKANNLQMENMYAQHTEYARRYVTHAAHQFETMKEQQRVNNRDFLKTQMQEKDARDKHFNEVVNTNYPTEDFFNQFGTSHR